jgi:hypothetical protein
MKLWCLAYKSPIDLLPGVGVPQVIVQTAKRASEERSGGDCYLREKTVDMLMVDFKYVCVFDKMRKQ